MIIPEDLDFAGAAEGIVFIRQPQVRFSWNKWQFALENPETVVTSPITAEPEPLKAAAAWLKLLESAELDDLRAKGWVIEVDARAGLAALASLDDLGARLGVIATHRHPGKRAG